MSTWRMWALQSCQKKYRARGTTSPRLLGICCALLCLLCLVVPCCALLCLCCAFLVVPQRLVSNGSEFCLAGLKPEPPSRHQPQHQSPNYSFAHLTQLWLFNISKVGLIKRMPGGAITYKDKHGNYPEEPPGGWSSTSLNTEHCRYLIDLIEKGIITSVSVVVLY